MLGYINASRTAAHSLLFVLHWLQRQARAYIKQDTSADAAEYWGTRKANPYCVCVCECV